jgi:hypothetical protein
MCDGDASHSIACSGASRSSASADLHPDRAPLRSALGGDRHARRARPFIHEHHSWRDSRRRFQGWATSCNSRACSCRPIASSWFSPSSASLASFRIGSFAPPARACSGGISTRVRPTDVGWRRWPAPQKCSQRAIRGAACKGPALEVSGQVQRGFNLAIQQTM